MSTASRSTIKKLQDQVQDQSSVLDDFSAAITGFRAENVKIKSDLLNFYKTLSTLSNRMAALEQHAAAIELYSTDRPLLPAHADTMLILKDLSTEMVEVTHAHDQIAQAREAMTDMLMKLKNIDGPCFMCNQNS